MGQDQPAILDLETVLDDLGVDDIIIIATSKRIGWRGIGPIAMGAGSSIQALGVRSDTARGHEVRCNIAVVIADIPHGQSLLQQITAAGEVGEHGA